MEEQCEKKLLELDHLFRKAVRKFVKERDKIMIEGINLPSMMILRRIFLSGEQRLSDLAEEMDLTSGAITAQSDKLEELGLADRIRYKGDRRTIYLQITEQGKAFMERYSHIGHIHASTIFHGFTEYELEQQLHIYNKLIENLEGLSEKIIAAAHQRQAEDGGRSILQLDSAPELQANEVVQLSNESLAEGKAIAQPINESKAEGNTSTQLSSESKAQGNVIAQSCNKQAVHNAQQPNAQKQAEKKQAQQQRNYFSY